MNADTVFHAHFRILHYFFSTDEIVVRFRRAIGYVAVLIVLAPTLLAPFAKQRVSRVRTAHVPVVHVSRKSVLLVEVRYFSKRLGGSCLFAACLLADGTALSSPNRPRVPAVMPTLPDA